MKNVDIHTLLDWMNHNQAELYDVREPGEWDVAHINGAKLVPLSQFDADKLTAPEGKKLVVHCKSGGRSSLAAQKLEELKNVEVYNLDGGIDAWMDAGLPTSRK